MLVVVRRKLVARSEKELWRKMEHARYGILIILLLKQIKPEICVLLQTPMTKMHTCRQYMQQQT